MPSKKEQFKIGFFFYNFDKLIALHKQQLDLLKEQKKELLQKMFPKEGSNVPELRFPEFVDPWEQRKLGEISNTTIGEFVIKSKQTPNGKYPVFNGGISNTGFYDEFNNSGNKILVSARGANAGYVNIIKNPFWAGNSCYSIELNDYKKNNIEFLYQEMKHKQQNLMNNQQAANIPAVSKSDIENFKVDLPSFEEQIKISSFLSNFDQLITLHQRKLDLLKEQKKGLLQKMFPEDGEIEPKLRFPEFK